MFPIIGFGEMLARIDFLSIGQIFADRAKPRQLLDNYSHVLCAAAFTPGQPAPETSEMPAQNILRRVPLAVTWSR
jgi:hypothetical protein